GGLFSHPEAICWGQGRLPRPPLSFLPGVRHGVPRLPSPPPALLRRPERLPRAGRETMRSGHDEDGWGDLPFEILAVHEGGTPAKEPLSHGEGGDWLFLDCGAGKEGACGRPAGVILTSRTVSRRTQLVRGNASPDGAKALTGTVHWRSVALVCGQQGGSHADR